MDSLTENNYPLSMKYEIGDEIMVMHTKESGKVVEIINEKMVMIEVRGVKFPAYMDQIDFPYFYRFSQKKIVEEKKNPKVYVDNIPKEKPKPNTVKAEEGVSLVFFPLFSFDEYNDEVVTKLKIHLVNKTNNPLKFTYKQLYGNDADFYIDNEIGAFQDFYIHDIDFERINDSPQFDFKFTNPLPVKGLASTISHILKIKPKQFFQKIESIKQQNLPTVNFKLFDKFPEEPKEDQKIMLTGNALAKLQQYQLTEKTKSVEAAKQVIDLHIEKLINDWKSLSTAEILDIQIRHFEKYFDLSLLHRQHTLTVIHGIGKGVLREEIHSILKLKPNVKTFINQYHPNYGYGATEIYFEY